MTNGSTLQTKYIQSFSSLNLSLSLAFSPLLPRRPRSPQYPGTGIPLSISVLTASLYTFTLFLGEALRSGRRSKLLRPFERVPLCRTPAVLKKPPSPERTHGLGDWPVKSIISRRSTFDQGACNLLWPGTRTESENHPEVVLLRSRTSPLTTCRHTQSTASRYTAPTTSPSMGAVHPSANHTSRVCHPRDYLWASSVARYISFPLSATSSPHRDPTSQLLPAPPLFPFRRRPLVAACVSGDANNELTQCAPCGMSLPEVDRVPRSVQSRSPPPASRAGDFPVHEKSARNCVGNGRTFCRATNDFPVVPLSSPDSRPNNDGDNGTCSLMPRQLSTI